MKINLLSTFKKRHVSFSSLLETHSNSVKTPLGCFVLKYYRLSDTLRIYHLGENIRYVSVNTDAKTLPRAYCDYDFFKDFKYRQELRALAAPETNYSLISCKVNNPDFNNDMFMALYKHLCEVEKELE